RGLPLAGGAVLLAVIVAGSTARAGWLTDAVALPALAFLGALLGCAAGLSRVRGGTALALAAGAAPLAAVVAVSKSASGSPAMGPMIAGWLHGLRSGAALDDPLLLLALLYLLFALLGTWLAWGLLRR